MKAEHNERVSIAIKYAKDVTAGKILSSHTTKLACKRFLNDLKKQEDEGWPFILDEEKAAEVCDFAESLYIPDLKKKLELLPWMIFVYVNVWGWKYKSDMERRRFRTAFCLLARKNSKTTSILFPWILYDFLTENSAESYMFSATGDQSEKSFKEVTEIIKGTEELNGIECYSGAITYGTSRISFFSSETSALDGYRNSLSVLDEYWNFADDKPVTASRYGGRARKNSLVTIITTAGFDISTPCYAEYKKAKSILEGVISDESYFTCIWEYDEKDDWKDPKNLIKANPSLGPILKQDILEADLADALITPSHVADFKAKTCSIFTNDVSTWIPMNKWSQCTKEFNYKILEGRPCYGGIDLSSVNDITAYTLCFPINGEYYFKHHFYIPEETVLNRRTENINYQEWIDKGFITVIPGPVIDTDFIFDEIREDYKKYAIQEIAYDRWQSNGLITSLNNDLSEITYIEFDQSLKKFSPVTKDYEKKVLSGKIHDMNPVMTWMINNVRIKATPSGDYKPLKDNKTSTQRIDGVISSIMALDRCKANTDIMQTPFNVILNSF